MFLYVSFWMFEECVIEYKNYVCVVIFGESSAKSENAWLGIFNKIALILCLPFFVYVTYGMYLKKDVLHLIIWKDEMKKLFEIYTRIAWQFYFLRAVKNWRRGSKNKTLKSYGNV